MKVMTQFTMCFIFLASIIMGHVSWADSSDALTPAQVNAVDNQIEQFI